MQATTGMGACMHANHARLNFFVFVLRIPNGILRIKAIKQIAITP